MAKTSRKPQQKTAQRKQTPREAPVAKDRKEGERPRCGLCGATKNLTRTECCGNWVCDDADQYELFSYAHNSCYRNHDRYTLCAGHFHEEHEGRWQDCKECRKSFETEMYVYYGTNEYNFEVLDNPPEYEPTLCNDCGKRIVLGDGGFMISGGKYFCGRCSAKKSPELNRYLK